MKPTKRITVARLVICLFTLVCIIASFDCLFKYRNARTFLAGNLKAGEYRLVMWKPFLVELQIGDPDRYNCTYTYAEFFGVYRLMDKVSERPEPRYIRSVLIRLRRARGCIDSNHAAVLPLQLDDFVGVLLKQMTFVMADHQHLKAQGAAGIMDNLH